MHSKLIDKIIGILLIAELFYLTFNFTHAFGGILELYQGRTLIILLIRIVLHFVLGISAAIFFFLHLPAVKWVFSAYVGITFLEKFWHIKPNTTPYLEMLEKLKESMPLGGSSANVAVNVSIYPFWWVWTLYFFVFIYVNKAKVYQAPPVDANQWRH
jgi:hypothetical protein